MKNEKSLSSKKKTSTNSVPPPTPGLKPKQKHSGNDDFTFSLPPPKSKLRATKMPLQVIPTTL